MIIFILAVFIVSLLTCIYGIVGKYNYYPKQPSDYLKTGVSLPFVLITGAYLSWELFKFMVKAAI